MSNVTVYMAGGMHDNWRDRIRDDDLFRTMDPMSHGLRDEVEYTAWDLQAIRNCDILFAVMDRSNPSGYGLMLEIGYAKALGKFVIFVEEDDDPRTRYYGMARVMADYYSTDLLDAQEFLTALLTAW